MNFDTSKPVEELDGEKWGNPPAESTSLVRGVYDLRRKPVASLEPDELMRLIGQDVGLTWLIPVALRHLTAGVPEANRGGWFDDDLLYSILTRSSDVWRKFPDSAQDVRNILQDLDEIDPGLQEAARNFHSAP